MQLTKLTLRANRTEPTLFARQGDSVAMRIDIIAVASVALGLGSCAVVDVAADTVDVAGTVVSTTVSVTGDVVGAAARTVSNSGQDKKPQQPQPPQQSQQSQQAQQPQQPQQ